MTNPHTPQNKQHLKLMREIIVRHNNQVIKHRVLSKQLITIGRDRQCDICLLDKTISRRHAMILNDAENSYIEDLDSTNGIFVNQTPVKQQKLEDGDVVSIGHFHLTFNDKSVDTK
jgi:pSer/pThr/pTyr-binding forkhead associated (FHA) protein